jgi:hypothetical protein
MHFTMWPQSLCGLSHYGGGGDMGDFYGEAISWLGRLVNLHLALVH